MAIKWRPRTAGQVQSVESDQRMWRGRLLRACLVALALLAVAAATRPAQAQANFDRPGGDYQQLAGPLRRSGGLRLGVRARPALPVLELQLSDRCRRRRGVLAEEQRAGARPGQLLRLRRARRRRGRAAQRRDRNLDRPVRRRLPQFRPERRRRRRRLQGGLHRRQQVPGLDLCPAGLCRQGRALLPEKRHQAAAAQGRDLSRAWCGRPVAPQPRTRHPPEAP